MVNFRDIKGVIVINGQRINLGGSSNIDIVGDKVVVNGKETMTISDKIVNVEVHGDVGGDVVTEQGDIKVSGNVAGNAKSSQGNVDVGGYVSGDVKTSQGNITCGDVEGSVKTSMGDIKINKEPKTPKSTKNKKNNSTYRNFFKARKD